MPMVGLTGCTTRPDEKRWSADAIASTRSSIDRTALTSASVSRRKRIDTSGLLSAGRRERASVRDRFADRVAVNGDDGVDIVGIAAAHRDDDRQVTHAAGLEYLPVAYAQAGERPFHPGGTLPRQ